MTVVPVLLGLFLCLRWPREPHDPVIYLRPCMGVWYVCICVYTGLEKLPFLPRHRILCIPNLRVSTQRAILRLQLGVLRFNSALTLSPGGSVRSHRVKARPHRAAPRSPFRCQSKVQIVTRASDLATVSSSDPTSLGSINLLE